MSVPRGPSPEDITRPERIGGTMPIGEDQKIGTTPSFQSYMQPGASPVGAPKTPQMSPFDLARGQSALTTGPTPQTLLAQVTAAQTTMGDLSTQLNTPNLKLKPSQKYLLKNKLSDATAYLRTANSKVGGEAVPEHEVAPGSGPIARFIGYVTNGQNQLEATKRKLQEIQNSGDSMNPAELMLVQLKLNKASQELEYASVLLSSAVSGMKMLFSVQL
jgi:hypothetical protein